MRYTKTNRSATRQILVFFVIHFFGHQLRGARLDSYRSRIHKMYTPDDDLCVWAQGDQITLDQLSISDWREETAPNRIQKQKLHIVIMIIGKLYLIYS